MQGIGAGARSTRLPGASPVMLERIRQLDLRLCTETPPLKTRDVRASGACFFLAGNLLRQKLSLAPLTTDEDALDAAGYADRVAVSAFMTQNLGSLLADGETLGDKLTLVRDFPGADGQAATYLSYMAKRDSWADMPILMCWQECFRVRFRLVSNLGNGALVDLPGWTLPTVSAAWPAGTIGHLEDLRDGMRVGVHFVGTQPAGVAAHAGDSLGGIGGSEVEEVRLASRRARLSKRSLEEIDSDCVITGANPVSGLAVYGSMDDMLQVLGHSQLAWQRVFVPGDGCCG